MDTKLPITEELDFAYLLELMPPLYDIPAFAWLPELFSIIGHERLVLLCKYAGGERIQIPTIEQLSSSIAALQWFYDIWIKHTADESSIPRDLKSLVYDIVRIYYARNG